MVSSHQPLPTPETDREPSPGRQPPPDRPGSEAADRIGLADAYALRTPDDSVELYRRWSDSYEDDFMVGHGYVYHTGVAELFAAEAGPEDGPVLDVGCGTGVVGYELAQRGRWAVDGLDISPEMLAKAEEKLNRAGEPVYGALIEADLTQPLDITTDRYGSVISAGTFTTGHVGPEAVAELARIVRPGGLLVLGVNSRFYDEAGFGPFLDRLVAEGRITRPKLPTIPVYDRTDHEHGSDTATIVITRCR